MVEQTAAPPTGAEDIAWKTEDLYTGVDDPQIEQDINEAERRIDEQAEAYRGRIAELSTEEMLDLIKTVEAIEELAYKPAYYASMMFTVDTADDARSALMAKVEQRLSELSQKSVFITLEIAGLPEEKAQALLEDPLLADYRHWIEVTRLNAPYLLSEPEERILTEKAVTGRSAWSRFFTKVQSAARYPLDGEEVTQEEVLQYLYHPDREQRRKAWQAVTEGLGRNKMTTTYIFNQILADKASDDRLRGYPTWITSRNISNEVDDDSVQAMIDAITSRYDIVHRYYRLKRELMGVDELYDYDRYAPLPTADNRYTWDEAREIVLESFETFHPQMAEVAGHFFEGGWIDAPPRPNKRGGAYATPTVPSVHPYIFLNYLGRARDVETLAHELGHGIHMYLSREQGILQAGTPLTTAETASVFAEMLVFQNLLAQEEDPATRLAMLTAKIEGSFATVFRQTAMNRFEDMMHTARREKGELSTDDLSAMWLKSQKDMHGDSVTMTDEYGLWWSYIPHFIGVPGYVYAYAFGELLVLALYARYQAQPEGFAEKYLAVLTKGGSDWPHEIMKEVGVDLTDPTFWQEGLEILDDLVKQAEDLAEQVNGS